MATDPKKKKKNIFSLVVDWFKAAAEWVPEHSGDPAIAQSIREDLGLKPGAQIDPDKSAKFVQFGAGVDPEKESFNEMLAEIKDVLVEINNLASTLETDDVPAVQISYMILSLTATNQIRVRFPFLFALSRAILFLGKILKP